MVEIKKDKGKKKIKRTDSSDSLEEIVIEGASELDQSASRRLKAVEILMQELQFTKKKEGDLDLDAIKSGLNAVKIEDYNKFVNEIGNRGGQSAAKLHLRQILALQLIAKSQQEMVQQMKESGKTQDQQYQQQVKSAQFYRHSAWGGLVATLVTTSWAIFSTILATS